LWALSHNLHLEGGARMSGVEANDVEPEIAQLTHKPRRRGASLDP
jgi:hypothetical protein